MHFFNLASVHRGIHFSDNSKHFCDICSVSIIQKTLLRPNYFFMSGAGRALAQRHKSGRPSGRRLKIASIGNTAAGAALVRYMLSYSILNDRDKKINRMFLDFRGLYECVTINSATAGGHSSMGDVNL